MIRSLLREPLLHFALSGALLFAVYNQLNPNAATGSSTISIEAATMTQLVADFRQTWHRDPNPAELQAMLDDYALEEILYREALALGLEQQDPIIRRRLRQKMELLSFSIPVTEPTESQLEQYLTKHKERYALPARYTFEQKFIRLDQPDAAVEQRVRDGQLKLAQHQAFASDLSLLPEHFSAVEPAQLARQLGQEFSEQLAKVQTGSWQGPIRSGLGMHFVLVTDVQPSQPASLQQVREQVERDWRFEQRQLQQQQLKTKLMASYRIEAPSPKEVLAP